jgi:lactate dehydrogenase-like 2-hydroxyacid dehydrogenase
MATWSNALVLSCPGGAATRHIVDTGVLDALGPSGWLVNVARGSVVDQEALIAALLENRLAGAGLDVLEGEPVVPPELIASDRVVLTPHYGASTAETKHLQASIMVEALVAQLGDGQRLNQRSPAD